MRQGWFFVRAMVYLCMSAGARTAFCALVKVNGRDVMHIQYYGFSCVKMTMKPGGRGSDDVVVVVNPFARDAGMTPPQMATAAAIIAAHERAPFFVTVPGAIPVTMPGEYAIRGVQIVGVQHAPQVDATAYLVEAEGLRVAILTGASSSPQSRVMDECAGADIVIIGVGGGDDAMAPDAAAEVVRTLAPAHVIPVHTVPSQVDHAAKVFATALGTPIADDGQKVVIKQRDCTEGAMHVHILTP